MRHNIFFLIISMSLPCIAYTQVLPAIADSSVQHVKDSIVHLPEKYLSQVKQKLDRIQIQVTKHTDKVLERLAKQENAMQMKLQKVDAVAAKNIFTGSIAKLNELRSGLKSKIPANLPIGGNVDLDTMENSLRFLNSSKALLGNSQAKLQSATNSVQELRGRLQQAEDIKTYIREHKQQLQEQCTIITYTKYLQNFTQWLEVESLTAAEVTYTGLLDYIRWLQEKGKKNAFIQHILCPLRHYFNYLVVTGERSDNPAAGLFIKGITRRLPGNLFSLEQLHQLYEQYNIQLHVPVVKKIMFRVTDLPGHHGRRVETAGSSGLLFTGRQGKYRWQSS